MKKVSIITLQYIDNYGSVLQTYATQYLFECLGCKAEVVNYTRANNQFSARLQVAKDKYSKRGGIWRFPPVLAVLLERWKRETNKKRQIYDTFRNRYLHLSAQYETPEDLMDHPPEADVYCTGSDQVWNYEYNGGVLPEYFLNYAPNGKRRMALSASFGKNEITEDAFLEMAPYIKRYTGISVREDSALPLLERMGFKGGIHLLDPTLLIDRSEWNQLVPSPRLVKEKYILLYQLNHSCEMERFAKKLSKETGTKLILISNNYKAFLLGKNYKMANVEEFLSLIRYAEYVITDSFHGTAFSVNFGKQLFVFYPPRYSTRLQSILSLIEHEERALNSGDIDATAFEPIDYKNVDSILSRERRKAYCFIRDMINNED